MRKFTKVALILAAVFAIVGVGSLIGAVAMGAVIGEPIQILEEEILEFSQKDEKQSVEVESDCIKIDEQIRGMDLEIGAGTVEIYYDDVAQIQVEQNNVNQFKCYAEEGELHVKGGTEVRVTDTDAKITIRIPKSMSFTEFDLEVSAGLAYVDGVIANEASIEVGVGKAEIKKLDAQKINIDVDAGELYVETAGKKEDYNYEIECGIGELIIGDSNYTGMNGEKTVQNIGATRVMDAECGIGKIEIIFVQ